MGTDRSQISIRALDEGEWETYRSVRLAALKESPEAFVATYADESRQDEQFWRDRMQRASRLLAERDGEPEGIVGVRQYSEDPEIGEIFGLWVRPESRGSGVARRLVEASAAQAKSDGRTQVYYWVGTENGRAVAFASSFGFRPTSRRRPMRMANEVDGEQEAALVLPLRGD